MAAKVRMTIRAASQSLAPSQVEVKKRDTLMVWSEKIQCITASTWKLLVTMHLKGAGDATDSRVRLATTHPKIVGCGSDT
jgi:hypothetical protein